MYSKYSLQRSQMESHFCFANSISSCYTGHYQIIFSPRNIDRQLLFGFGKHLQVKIIILCVLNS